MRNQNKLLNEEVNRLLEIMGIQKKLLLEQGFIDDLIEKIILAAEKKGTKTAAEEFVNKFERATTPDEKAKIFQDFWDKSDIFLRKEINELMQEKFTLKLQQEIEEIYDSVDTEDFIKIAIDRNADDESIIKMMVDDFNPNTGDDVMDAIVKSKLKGRIRTRIKLVKNAMDDVVPPRPVEEPLPPKSDETPPVEIVIDDVIPDVVDDIPQETLNDIWDARNWNSVPLPANLPKTINPNLFKDFVEKLKNMWIPSKNKIRKIQQIAKQIEQLKKAGTDADLQIKLERRLRQELEWIYRNNTNYFVYIRKYFDDVAKDNKVWRDAWEQIKGNSGGNEWEFYKNFGQVAQYMPTFGKFWSAVKTDLKLLFEPEIRQAFLKSVYNLFNKTKPIKIEDAKTSFLLNLATGSRRGFPTMTNKHYKEIISKYGLRGAKTVYYRDIVVNFFKWHIYLGLLETIIDMLANAAYGDDVQACIQSKDPNSQACKEINDNFFSKTFSEWSMNYTTADVPIKTGGFLGAWGRKINPFSEENLPNIDLENNIWAKNLSEILKLDPGAYGNILNGVIGLLDNHDMSKTSELEKQIHKFIKNAEIKANEYAIKLRKANEGFAAQWSKKMSDIELKKNQKLLELFIKKLSKMDPPRTYEDESFSPEEGDYPAYARDNFGVEYEYRNLKWEPITRKTNVKTYKGDEPGLKDFLKNSSKTYSNGTFMDGAIPYGEDTQGNGYQFKNGQWVNQYSQ